MRIEYQISEQDFINAQRLAIRNSPLQVFRWTRLVFPVFGLMLLLFVMRTAQRQGLSVSMTPAFVICLFFLSMPLLNRLTQKKMYARNTAMHGPLSAELDERGISFQGLTFSSQFDWSNFSRFFEDDNSFVLYRTTQLFNLIPKRGLAPDEISVLHGYFQRKIGASK